MEQKHRILRITRTAILIALLIVLQAATTPLGTPLLTGSIVNLLLIISVMTCGLPSGLCVAAVSPILAKLFGIGPIWSLIPFIAVGNIVLVVLWHLIGSRSMGGKTYIPYLAALVAAAVAKFLVLYVGIVKIAIPLFLDLPKKQAAVISNMFSVPQLATALMGGVLALALIPRLKQALAGGRE
jgi:uncharacterized membrane protein